MAALVGTFPDIAFAAGYNSAACVHWEAAKGAVCYLKGTKG